MYAHKLDSISQEQLDHNKSTECPQNLQFCELVYHLNHRAGGVDVSGNKTDYERLDPFLCTLMSSVS